MALRGIKPVAVEKRLKAFFYGYPNTWKTRVSIQFARPYLIDTERGAENEEYVQTLEQSGGAYFFSNDFDDITEEVKSLLTDKHEYRTLVIDPLTVPYNACLDKEALRLAQDGSEGTEFGRNKKAPDRKVRHLLNLLVRLDMNVIITSHAKPKWEKVGKDFREAGDTFDAYSKLEYIFDLVFEVQKRSTERWAIVRKTRCSAFRELEQFPFSYQEIAKRYGQDILERKAGSETLATPEQVAEVTRLVELLSIPEDRYGKWLDKAMADDWDEMPEAAIVKTIDYLKQQILNGVST